MEQLLINQLIDLICKAGGQSLIKDLIRETDQDGNMRAWTAEEIENATTYLHNINLYFGKGDAVSIVENLSQQYNIKKEDLATKRY